MIYARAGEISHHACSWSIAQSSSVIHQYCRKFIGVFKSLMTLPQYCARTFGSRHPDNSKLAKFSGPGLTKTVSSARAGISFPQDFAKYAERPVRIPRSRPSFHGGRVYRSPSSFSNMIRSRPCPCAQPLPGLSLCLNPATRKRTSKFWEEQGIPALAQLSLPLLDYPCPCPGSQVPCIPLGENGPVKSGNEATPAPALARLSQSSAALCFSCACPCYGLFVSCGYELGVTGCMRQWQRRC